MTIEEAEALEGKPTRILLIRPGCDYGGRRGVMHGLSRDKKRVLIKWDDSENHIFPMPVKLLRQMAIMVPTPSAGPEWVHEVGAPNLPMRWYARPEGDSQKLNREPRLACWERADHPDQVRLRAYLDDTEGLLAASRVDGPWALRLDVGLPTELDLLKDRDLDNYAYPLADRLYDPNLVSVWCTKRHSEESFVRVEAAREVPPLLENILLARTTGVSIEKPEYKEQVRAAVAGAPELPEGAVRLELGFVFGRHRYWLNLWKATIDALGPLLGRDPSGKGPWCPRDGRITELGMHQTVDPALGHKVVIGIAAAPA